MPEYVDGFVVVVPKKNVADYRKMAKLGAKVWMDHGALSYRECQGDDLGEHPGVLSFPKLAKTKPGETVFFSFITFRSRTHRDRVNKKVMADPRMQEAMGPSPIDMSKMAYGGFKVLVGAP